MANAKEEYRQKLLDPRWQKMRLQVYERDGFRCRSCGGEEATLHAHHTYYRYGADPWDYPPSSIITLCADCHTLEHERIPDVKEMIVRNLCDAGLGMTQDIYDVAYCFWSVDPQMDQDEKRRFLSAMKAVFDSRNGKSSSGDGELWERFLSAGDALGGS